jgi:hypothetical protein
MVMLKDKKSSKAKPGVNPPKTEGLTPLDVDRAASVANEGGASAATTEVQRPPRQSVEQAVNTGGTGEDSGDCGCAGPVPAETRRYARPASAGKL